MRLGGSRNKAKGTTTSAGRCRVLVGRFVRKCLVRGLPNRTTAKGCGPESKQEVSEHVQKHVSSNCLVAPDGAPAWFLVLHLQGSRFCVACPMQKRCLLQLVGCRKRIWPWLASTGG